MYDSQQSTICSKPPDTALSISQQRRDFHRRTCCPTHTKPASAVHRQKSEREVVQLNESNRKGKLSRWRKALLKKNDREQSSNVRPVPCGRNLVSDYSPILHTHSQYRHNGHPTRCFRRDTPFKKQLNHSNIKPLFLTYLTFARGLSLEFS